MKHLAPTRAMLHFCLHGGPGQVKAGNSKVNMRDQSTGAVTANQQKSESVRPEVEEKIRQSNMADNGG